MRIELPKRIKIDYTNHGYGLASAKYFEIIECSNKKDAITASRNTVLILKKLKEALKSRADKEFLRETKFKFDIKSKVINKRGYLTINMAFTVEAVVQALINELQTQVQSKETIKENVNKGVRKIVGKKGIREINKECRRMSK